MGSLSEQTRSELRAAASRRYIKFYGRCLRKPTDAENYGLVEDAFLDRGFETHTADGRFSDDYAAVLLDHVLMHHASDCTYTIGADTGEITYWPPLAGSDQLRF